MTKLPVDRATFAVAVILLTVAISVVLVMATRDGMQGVWGWIAAIIAGGLLVNAAGHAAQSVIALAPVPGVYTGIMLVAPTAALVLTGFNGTRMRAWQKRTFALLLGAAAMPVVALAALRLADVLMAWLG